MVSVKEFKINYNNNELIYKFNPQDNTLNKITITFNNNLYAINKNLKPGEVNLTFKNQEDILRLVQMFFVEIATKKNINQDIKIVFEINSQNRTQEEQIAKKIIEVVGLKHEVIYKDPKKEEQKLNKKIEEEQKELTAKGTNRITTQGIDGINKNYTINEKEGIIREDNNNLSEFEEKQSLLKEWLNDPIKKEWAENLTPEQLNIELTNTVALTKKQYNLSSPTEVKPNDELADVSKEVANQKKDGKVNTEIGIVIDNGKITAIEEKMNGNFNLVNPEVKEQVITGTNTNQEQVSEVDKQMYNNDEYNVTEIEEEIEEREVENIYYIDDSNNIYNSLGEIIGALGQKDGYYIDVNNNLVKNGEVIGPVENIRDMKSTKEQKNTKKKILQPNGYISFMLTTVVISLILLTYVILSLK